jgi:hypothetical protein
MSEGLLAAHGSAYGISGCREMFCLLVRFRREADMSSPVVYRWGANDPKADIGSQVSIAILVSACPRRPAGAP